jgi:hypothetical protein
MSKWKSEEEKRQTILDFIVAGAIINQLLNSSSKNI